jgi:uncharacterized protein (UPF0262 family)
MERQSRIELINMVRELLHKERSLTYLDRLMTSVQETKKTKERNEQIVKINNFIKQRKK